MSALITAYIHLTATRYMQVAATAAISYDYLLTLHYEIEYFWRSLRWTWAHVLFFANRYFAIFAIALNTGALLSPTVTDRFCTVWVRYLVTGFGAIEIFVVQAILIVRLYAMYHGNKALLVSLLVGWFLSALAAVIIVSLAVKNNPVTAHPAPGLVVCASLAPPKSLWAFWVPILVFEATAFTLALSKSVLHLWRSPYTQSTTVQLIEVILRDSVVYFLVIFITYLVNALIWRYASPDLLDVLHGPALAIVSVLGSRMMINIRETRETLPTEEDSFELTEVGKRSGRAYKAFAAIMKKSAGDSEYP